MMPVQIVAGSRLTGGARRCRAANKLPTVRASPTYNGETCPLDLGAHRLRIEAALRLVGLRCCGTVFGSETAASCPTTPTSSATGLCRGGLRYRHVLGTFETRATWANGRGLVIDRFLPRGRGHMSLHVGTACSHPPSSKRRRHRASSRTKTVPSSWTLSFLSALALDDLTSREITVPYRTVLLIRPCGYHSRDDASLL